MLTLISRIDGLLQKMVDSAAFFLMRQFGWRKAYIRYCLIAVSCASLAGLITVSVRVNGFGGWAVIMSLLLAGWMAVTHMGYAQDSGHEDDKAMLYPYDVRRLPMLPSFKCMWLFFLILDVLDAVNGPSPGSKVIGGLHTFHCACEIVFNISLLLECYLVKTPRVPPALEEKKTVLVPAYANARK